ncbi:replication initiation factor domain-containing protein [Desulfosporosinus sp. PR]|uniref:replication initiation factor domain-containing protein n=1 Tax=Candidatus Desulfosporosinus nitrosoreducens TaxID=3401928 RepID=UPI0027FC8FEB|nr:replication initiation factor domain-containing protein [Desulfosporosinus sp. PR]MDQ7095000.1 replication initiation factor domain-containing protein [Desulfosporosinus sp. PR]
MQKQISLEINQNQELVPPSSNTGAQSTGQRILIDWLAFTVPSWVDIFDVLGIPGREWVPIDTKALGYDRMFMHGQMKVYQSDREDMGSHCELSGHACREYEFFFDGQWRELIKRVRNSNGQFSRIDLAIDDFDGLFTLEQVEQKVKNSELISYFRKGRILEEFNLSDKDNLGKTIYFGSPQSRIRIRMYDKAIEQLLKYQSSLESEAIQQESRSKVSQTQRTINKQLREEGYRRERLEHSQIWNRTEIQSRDERADSISDYILADLPLGQVVFGVLKNYLNFVEPSLTDSNKSRWEISSFWLVFLGSVEALKLTTEKVQTSLKKIKNWVIKQVAPSLALLSLDKNLNVNLEELVEIILFARNRLKKRHYALLQAS